MIVSFIAVGILSGPSLLDIVQSSALVDLLAELGIALLLFLVGLKLDLQLVRSLGVVSLATGLGQVLFTAIIGFLIAQALGFETITSLYVAIALTFSSTIIIVKLLSDKKEVDALHGRIAVGFLIVQDIFVVLAMMALSAFGVGAAQEGNIFMHIATVVLYGALLLLAIVLFIRYVADRLVERMAHSPELLITFAIGWAALLAALGDYLGFSKELGGLLAGMSLASTAYREIIVARMAALRDFLLLFIFIALGIHLDLSLLGAQILAAVIFSLFVLIGNPLIVMMIMGVMGYRKRTSFLAGLTVAQISEFSLIFIAMGLTLGHVNNEALGLVTLVGLITIAMSVYMITYSHQLYAFLEPLLAIFERKVPWREKITDLQINDKSRYDIILLGAGRYGSALSNALSAEGYKLLIVDFNPDEVRRRQTLGYDAIYGDASDPEFIASLPLAKVRCVILAMSQHGMHLREEDSRIVLIDTLRHNGYKGQIAVTVQHHDVDSDADARRLLQHGANMIFLPYRDAAKRATERIQAQFDK